MIPISRHRWLLAITMSLLASGAFASPTRSPEHEVAELAKLLRPIPDNQWKDIAGNRISETYDITKGDTLWDLSKRLFGDAKYWPKVWALNNPSITNPHQIRPGNKIAFLPGTGTALPAVAINSLPKDNEGPVPAAGTPMSVQPMPAGRSQEWKKLERQSWENVQAALPPEIDPDGFDRRSKISFGRNTGFDISAFATAGSLTTIGQIVSAKSPALLLGLGDLLFILAEEPLQIGMTYGITPDPYPLKNAHADRVGYVHHVQGRVKILALKDGYFIGKITRSSDPILRGASLIPLPAKIQNLTPVAATQAVEGTLIVDPVSSTSLTVQNRLVYIDRGSEDGVKQGMVFRIYTHTDPSNSKNITKSNFIVEGDVQVIHTSESFSTGLIISSRSPITTGSPAILLTDISDVMGSVEIQVKSADSQPDAELDTLDTKGNGALSDQEKREVEELEKAHGESGKKEKPAPELPMEEAPTPPGVETPATEAPADPALDAPVAEEPPAPPAPATPPALPSSPPKTPPPPSGLSFPATEPGAATAPPAVDPALDAPGPTPAGEGEMALPPPPPSE